MKKTVEKICAIVSDIIFGTSRSLSMEEISLLPRALNEHPFIFSLFSYRYASVKKCIWSLKYDGDRQLAKQLAKLLYDAILEDESERYAFGISEKSLIIPLPARPSRMKEHGFNQCERLVRELQKIDNGASFDFSYDSLIKIKDTSSQAHTKNKTERLSHLKDSFAIKNKIQARNIIIIDDVWTTGATINEVRAELLKAGARTVRAYTIAH